MMTAEDDTGYDSPLRSGRSAISNKIRKLRSEDVPEDQAVAMAINMQRQGRLTPKGAYIRKTARRQRGRRM